MNYRFDLEEEPLAAEAYAGFDGDEEFDAEPADWEWESEPTDEPEALDFEWDDLEWQGEINRRSRDYIRWVQRSLNQILRTRLAVDGIIGTQTRSAIRRFQQQRGLTVDGVVGPQTERALIAAGAESPPILRITPKPQAPGRPIPTPLGGRCRFRFTPRPVETPGGGRIKDRTPPRADDLVEVRGIGGRRIRLHRLAAEAWNALISAARSDGISPPLLLPTSGFRDPEHQRRLWKRALERYGSPQAARKWVAPPGSSPHQSGRAIDFHLGGKNSSGNVANLRRLPAYKWLVENAACFGFYPYEAEPWHWEYNPPAATKEVGAFDTELTNLWQSEVNRNSPDYIRWVQRSLNQILGTHLAVDGIIGTQTRSAIRRFQQQGRLTVDGIVGSQTEAALIATGAESPPRRAVTPSPGRPTTISRAPELLESLRSYIQPSTTPTIANALSIVRIISSYHHIPWKIGYIILEHEGGVRLFRHSDGVMQTTSSARRSNIPRIPRPLKLALLGLSLDDRTPEDRLTARLLSEFPRRLTVQIAAGIQELKENLQKFSGYVALAFQAYNAGSGWAYYTATLGRQKTRPRGISDLQWENMCRFGASLLHQPVQNLDIKTGVWQCDANIPAWFSHIPVYDRQAGLQLIAFKYLRSIRECIRGPKPSKSLCTRETHKKRVQGSGKEVCRNTRPGALDKLYRPNLLGRIYYEAARDELLPVQEDGHPLKVIDGRLVKMPLMSSMEQETWSYSA